MTRAALPFVASLMLSAVLVVVPALAGLIMTGRMQGSAGVVALLGRLRVWPGLGWIVTGLMIMPVVEVASMVLQ